MHLLLGDLIRMGPFGCWERFKPMNLKSWSPARKLMVLLRQQLCEWAYASIHPNCFISLVPHHDSWRAFASISTHDLLNVLEPILTRKKDITEEASPNVYIESHKTSHANMVYYYAHVHFICSSWQLKIEKNGSEFWNSNHFLGKMEIICPNLFCFRRKFDFQQIYLPGGFHLFQRRNHSFDPMYINIGEKQENANYFSLCIMLYTIVVSP